MSFDLMLSIFALILSVTSLCIVLRTMVETGTINLKNKKNKKKTLNE